MAAIELIQSMRVGTFGDFVVLGSQYKDEAGANSEKNSSKPLDASEKPY